MDKQPPKTYSNAHYHEVMIDKKEILNEIECFPTKGYNNSGDYLGITKQSNSIVIINNAPNYNWSQCYLEYELKRDKRYIVQYTIQNVCNAPPSFIFGLIGAENKNTNWIGDDNLYFCESGGAWVTTILKGGKVTSDGDDPVGARTFEIRVNLKEHIFKVSTPPLYENIQEIAAKENFDDNKTYLFGIAIYNPSDWITIDHIFEVASQH